MRFCFVHACCCLSILLSICPSSTNFPLILLPYSFPQLPIVKLFSYLPLFPQAPRAFASPPSTHNSPARFIPHSPLGGSPLGNGGCVGGMRRGVLCILLPAPRPTSPSSRTYAVSLRRGITTVERYRRQSFVTRCGVSAKGKYPNPRFSPPSFLVNSENAVFRTFQGS
jgi:hypothetical protein